MMDKEIQLKINSKINMEAHHHPNVLRNFYAADFRDLCQSAINLVTLIKKEYGMEMIEEVNKEI
jgi:hypothetical protein